MTILELNNITKHYKTVTALNNVSLIVPEGSVYGILGPNGSGKTTLLGLCAGLDRSSSGNVELQHTKLEAF